MAIALESPSPTAAVYLNKESRSLISSSSEKRFWRTLRSRFDALIENQKPIERSPLPAKMKDEAKRMKQESKLLVRGFDSMAHSMAQFSNSLDNALQGARNLTREYTFPEILEDTIRKAKIEENRDSEMDKRGLKRKLDCSSFTLNEDNKEDFCSVKAPSSGMGKLKKAKNMAISITTDVASMARDLKSVRLDLEFMQERCTLLEEENAKLRDGLAKDEDDLVRLQLEALLAEKSRLANENTNLKRENKRLHQLVEYHQPTSQDLSVSLEIEAGCEPYI